MRSGEVVGRRIVLKRLAGLSVGLLTLACQPVASGPTASPPKPTEAPRPAAPTVPSTAPAAPAASAPTSVQAAPAAKGAPAPMKIGLQENVLAVPSQVAIQGNFFEKHGLKVEGIRFESGGNIVRDAIVANHIEAGTFFVATFILGAVTGRVSAYFASHGVSRGSGIIANPGIKAVADLKGKKIGGSRGTSISQLFEHKIAPAHGLRSDDYTWVPLGSGGTDSLGAFIAGQIDAYPSTEPFLSLGVKQGGVLITDYTPYDPLPIFVAGSTGFAEKNPDSVIALTKGWLDMARWWNDNPQEVLDIARSYLSAGGEPVEDDVLKVSLERLDLKPDLTRGVMEPYIKESAELLLKVGSIKQLPDFGKTVRYDLWEKATKA